MFPTGSQPAANAVLHCIGGRLFNAVSTADYMLSTVTGMTKDGLLQDKRAPFRIQKAAYRKARGGILEKH